jgi:hypothetical protein
VSWIFPAGYRQGEGLAVKDFSWRTGEFEPDPFLRPTRQSETSETDNMPVRVR